MRAHILNNTWLPFYHDMRERLDARDSYGPKSVRYAKSAHQEKALSLGRFKIVSPKENPRIQDSEHGEIMHSINDPWTEANQLYAAQSQITVKASAVDSSPLIIWDVGLGAATNAMAALQTLENAAETVTSKRGVHMYSFENDLDALRLAAKFPSMFKHLKHEAPHKLLKNRHWKHPTLPIEWTLIEGDFAKDFTNAPAAHVIFYDPFSFKSNPDLWTYELFKKIFSHCQHQPCELMTYTNSTAIRAGLLAAGFFVGKGAATGPKSETTYAMTEHARHHRSDVVLLDEQWLLKWSRSDAKHPFGVATTDHDVMESISNHLQFRRH